MSQGGTKQGCCSTEGRHTRQDPPVEPLKKILLLKKFKGQACKCVDAAVTRRNETDLFTKTCSINGFLAAFFFMTHACAHTLFVYEQFRGKEIYIQRIAYDGGRLSECAQGFLCETGWGSRTYTDKPECAVFRFHIREFPYFRRVLNRTVHILRLWRQQMYTVYQNVLLEQ